MNRDTLKQIMVDQKDIYLNNPLIVRYYPLAENVNYCFVGIRRTGKSYIMYQQIKTLLDKDIPLSQIVYVNFEDERLLEMTSDDLNTILEIGLELSGTEHKPYLFLDEVQNINGWEKFVRRIADMKYKVSITGSNRKMLSNEIASTLGGRFVIMKIYPYSFAEYLIANGKRKYYLDTISTSDKADVLAQYHEYVTFGAFPELVEIKNKRTSLSSIYQTVYLGDIITRNKITNELVEKETSPKYYFMDTGLVGLMLLDCKSAQLENLVAIELLRRYGQENVFYFENNVKIDFYVPAEKLAIQVSLKVLDDMDTRERETRAFAKLRNFIPDSKCLIITNSEEAALDCDGISISVIPAWKWLLDTPER